MAFLNPFFVLAVAAAQTAPDAASADEANAVGVDLDPATSGFDLGTYGRVNAGSNLRGGRGSQLRLVAHPPRLLADPYVELDVGHTLPAGEGSFRTQLTVAFGSELFHFDGDFDAAIAVRNLYVEARDLVVAGLSLWVGSRMARGDDIYLLDFWPLDEQNTVGGGATFAWGETEVKLHLGVNRLDDLFQSQTITVPGEELGTREVLFLDRQRAVASARGEQRFALNDETRLKTVLYAEGHGLPGGEVRTPDARTERMPADEGYLLGAEVGVWGFAPQSFANLFVRFATGLAAYDELGVPFGLGTDKRAARARELLVGFSGNVELSSRLALLTGAYGRYFLDADPNVFDRDDVWDVGAAIRPAWFLTEHLHLLAEANVQYLRPNGLSPETGRHEKPLAVSLAVMPALSLGRGSFSRPQLALIYSATLLNEASRLELAAADPARDTAVRHFVGVGVEWWLNSSRYQGGSP